MFHLLWLFCSVDRLQGFVLNCNKQEALTIALRQEGSPESLWPRYLAGDNQSHSTGFGELHWVHQNESQLTYFSWKEQVTATESGGEIFYCPAGCFSEVRNELPFQPHCNPCSKYLLFCWHFLITQRRCWPGAPSGRLDHPINHFTTGELLFSLLVPSSIWSTGQKTNQRSLVPMASLGRSTSAKRARQENP